jgi:hypothetical protein
MGFLKVPKANLSRWNMRRDSEHRNVIAVAIEKTIDQVQIARPATARAHGKPACCSGIGAGSKCRDLFMACVHPADRIHSIEAVGKTVQAVTGHSPDTLNTGSRQGLRQMIGDRSTHDVFLS